MSNSNEATPITKMRVGLFTAGGLLLLGVLTVYVNNRPFWWRPCNLAQVTVEDATGLKPKSPVKSLGLEIGYIYDIGLVASGVRIKLCITAPIEIQSETRAYVRSEGFLGDRFLELKPVKYIGNHVMEEPVPATKAPGSSSSLLWDVIGIHSAFAEESDTSVARPQSSESVAKNGKDIPVAERSADMQQVMSQLNGLMKEVKSVTTNLKDSINPDEIRGTVRQLNKTLEVAAKVLSPDGGLTVTAQRSLIKLEDAIEQLRDQMTRINQGEGSVGKILNDPVYAEELKKAMKNLNHLLNRASELRLIVTAGLQQLTAFSAARSFFEVTIIPKPDRFYLIGLTNDPRGKISQVTTTTQVAGTSTTVQSTQVEKGIGFAFTAMIGKYFNDRLQGAVGMIHGDGGALVGINLGPKERPESLQLMGELYFRSGTDAGTWSAKTDARTYLLYQPFSTIYLSAGMEGFRTQNGSTSAFFGGGLRFDDEDIKLLFSFL